MDLAARERTSYVLGRPVPILKKVVRPQLTMSAVLSGLQFPGLQYVVDRDFAVGYTGALGREEAWYMSVGAPGPYAPPAWFANDVLQAVSTCFAQAGRAHGRQQLWIYAPLPLNTEVYTQTGIVGSYRKGKHDHVLLECIANTLAGDTVGRARADVVL